LSHGGPSALMNRQLPPSARPFLNGLKSQDVIAWGEAPGNAQQDVIQARKAEANGSSRGPSPVRAAQFRVQHTNTNADVRWVNRKSRQGLLLAFKGAAAFICTILAFRVLAMPLKGLPPQLLRMTWPLLAIEL